MDADQATLRLFQFIMPGDQTFVVNGLSVEIVLRPVAIEVGEAERQAPDRRPLIQPYSEILEVRLGVGRVQINGTSYSIAAPGNAMLYNALGHRVSTYRLWRARLTQGVFKSLLESPEKLQQLSQNYQIFGHLQRDRLAALSGFVKRQGFAAQWHRRYQGEFGEVDFVLTGRFERHGGVRRQSSRAVAQGYNAARNAYLCTLQGLRAREYEAATGLRALYGQVNRQRGDVLGRTGLPEQVAAKAIIDCLVLARYGAAGAAVCRDANRLLRAGAPLAQTVAVLRDFTAGASAELLRSGQLVAPAYTIVRDVNISDVDVLDPIDYANLVSISVQELVFHAVDF